MVFNGEANNNDLCTLADDFAKTNDTSFPLAKKARAANIGLRIIFAVIYEVYGGWHMDDSNNTDLPEGTANLVASQSFYALPSIASLNGVSFMDSSSTWHKLTPITVEEIKERGYAEEEFMKTAGYPLYYRPVANGFKLYPASDASRSSALGIDVNRDVSTFTATSTSVEPGFDSLFHEALAVFMAMHHTEINHKSTWQNLMKKWDNDAVGVSRTFSYPPGYIQRIKAHYQTKFRQLFPQNIKAKGRPNFVNQYE